MEKQQQTKLVEVTLDQAHEHAGVAHAVGDRIEVSEPERNWLVEHGIVSAPSKAKESK